MIHLNKKKASEIIRYIDRDVVEEKMQNSNGWVPGRMLDGIEPKFAKRGELEEDESKLQTIPYVILKYGNRILVYKRAGSEERLLGQLSIGFGGHSNKKDNDIEDTAIREIKEELSMKLDKSRLEPRGYIFSNDTSVSRVHIGYLFFYELRNKELNTLQVTDEIELAFLEEKGVLVNNQINKYTKLELEDWSSIAVKALK